MHRVRAKETKIADVDTDVNAVLGIVWRLENVESVHVVWPVASAAPIQPEQETRDEYTHLRAVGPLSQLVSKPFLTSCSGPAATGIPRRGVVRHGLAKDSRPQDNGMMLTTRGDILVSLTHPAFTRFGMAADRTLLANNNSPHSKALQECHIVCIPASVPSYRPDKKNHGRTQWCCGDDRTVTPAIMDFEGCEPMQPIEDISFESVKIKYQRKRILAARTVPRGHSELLDWSGDIKARFNDYLYLRRDGDENQADERQDVFVERWSGFITTKLVGRATKGAAFKCQALTLLLSGFPCR